MNTILLNGIFRNKRVLFPVQRFWPNIWMIWIYILLWVSQGLTDLRSISLTPLLFSLGSRELCNIMELNRKNVHPCYSPLLTQILHYCCNREPYFLLLLSWILSLKWVNFADFLFQEDLVEHICQSWQMLHLPFTVFFYRWISFSGVLY